MSIVVWPREPFLEISRSIRVGMSGNSEMLISGKKERRPSVLDSKEFFNMDSEVHIWTVFQKHKDRRSI